MHAHLKPKINQRMSNEGFGRMIGAARINRRECNRAEFAPHAGRITDHQDEILCCKENDGRIAMLVGWNVRPRMIAFCSHIMIVRMNVMIMVMRVAVCAAEAHLARKWIGEMRMVMRMFHPIL